MIQTTFINVHRTHILISAELNRKMQGKHFVKGHGNPPECQKSATPTIQQVLS